MEHNSLEQISSLQHKPMIADREKAHVMALAEAPYRDEIIRAKTEFSPMGRYVYIERQAEYAERASVKAGANYDITVAAETDPSQDHRIHDHLEAEQLAHRIAPHMNKALKQEAKAERSEYNADGFRAYGLNGAFATAAFLSIFASYHRNRAAAHREAAERAVDSAAK